MTEPYGWASLHVPRDAHAPDLGELHASQHPERGRPERLGSPSTGTPGTSSRSAVVAGPHPDEPAQTGLDPSDGRRLDGVGPLRATTRSCSRTTGSGCSGRRSRRHRDAVHTHLTPTLQYIESGSHFVRRDEAARRCSTRGRTRFVLPQVQFAEPIPRHTIENTGDDDLVVIGVELRSRPPAADADGQRRRNARGSRRARRRPRRSRSAARRRQCLDLGARRDPGQHHHAARADGPRRRRGPSR